MITRVDKILDEYIQAVFDVAMIDLIVTEDELILLRIVEDKIARIREQLNKQYHRKDIEEKELRKSINEAIKAIMPALSFEAISDGVITNDEMAILQTLSA